MKTRSTKPMGLTLELPDEFDTLTASRRARIREAAVKALETRENALLREIMSTRNNRQNLSREDIAELTVIRKRARDALYEDPTVARQQSLPQAARGKYTISRERFVFNMYGNGLNNGYDTAIGKLAHLKSELNQFRKIFYQEGQKLTKDQAAILREVLSRYFQEISQLLEMGD